MTTSSALTKGRNVGRVPDMTLIAPSTDAEAIDISGADHAISSPNGAKGLFVGGAGNVKMQTIVGNTRTFTGVVAGTILPIQFDTIFMTDTTATNMMALL